MEGSLEQPGLAVLVVSFLMRGVVSGETRDGLVWVRGNVSVILVWE